MSPNINVDQMSWLSTKSYDTPLNLSTNHWLVTKCSPCGPWSRPFLPPSYRPRPQSPPRRPPAPPQRPRSAASPPAWPGRRFSGSRSRQPWAEGQRVAMWYVCSRLDHTAGKRTTLGESHRLTGKRIVLTGSWVSLATTQSKILPVSAFCQPF